MLSLARVGRLLAFRCYVPRSVLKGTQPRWASAGARVLCPGSTAAWRHRSMSSNGFTGSVPSRISALSALEALYVPHMPRPPLAAICSRVCMAGVRMCMHLRACFARCSRAEWSPNHRRSPYQVARQQPVRRRDLPGRHHVADKAGSLVRPRRSCRAVRGWLVTNAPLRDLGKCNITGRVPSEISVLTLLTKLCAHSPARQLDLSQTMLSDRHAFFHVCMHLRMRGSMYLHANAVHASPPVRASPEMMPLLSRCAG